MNAAPIERFLANADDPPARASAIFATEGVVAVRQIIPPTVSGPTADYLATALRDLAELFGRYDIAYDSPDAGQRVAQLLGAKAAKVPAEDRHILLGHFPLAVRLDKALWRIPIHLADEPVLREILGSEKLFVHMPPTARFVLPGNFSAAVPAHQDITYNRHLGPFCIAWVPLVDIDTSCGGMTVFPRTQGRGDLSKADMVAPPDGWIPAIDTSAFERAELQPLARGDVVFMGNETVHESMPNRSLGIRFSIDFRFFGESSSSTKHYLDLTRQCVVAPAT